MIKLVMQVGKVERVVDTTGAGENALLSRVPILTGLFMVDLQLIST